MGDGVNIAARLESTSEPNCICLSEDAYRQVRDRIKEAIDLGEKELKNIAASASLCGQDWRGGFSTVARFHIG